jgi:hypothetical protein
MVAAIFVHFIIMEPTVGVQRSLVLRVGSPSVKGTSTAAGSAIYIVRTEETIVCCANVHYY